MSVESWGLPESKAYIILLVIRREDEMAGCPGKVGKQSNKNLLETSSNLLSKSFTFLSINLEIQSEHH